MSTNLFRSVILSGGNQCFVKCPGCYNYFGKSNYETDDLLYFLSEIKGRMNIKKVTVAGGDPLVRPDISYLLKQIKNMGFYINLDTVGLALVRDVPINRKLTVKRILPSEIVPFVDMIGIPLDGSNDQIIQLFRRKLCKIDIINILETLKVNDAPVCINTVVHKGNLNDVTNIYDAISRFTNIEKWQIFQYMSIGPAGYKNRGMYEIQDIEYLKVRENLLMQVKDCLMDIQFKSRTQRKNKYLLVDGDGVIWIPKQDDKENWHERDVNNERVILGNVKDRGDFRRIIDILKSNVRQY